MSDPLHEAHRLLTQAVDALRAATGPTASDEELLSSLTVCEGIARQLDHTVISAVAELGRRGSFTERGYRSPVSALGDLVGWERFEARRRVIAAEQTCPRIGLDGSELPARLPAMATAFAAGLASLRHVEMIAKVLESGSAQRLTPEVWAAVETELADKARLYTPTELAGYGGALVDRLDADGAEPDDREPPAVNELHWTRCGSGGGVLKGRIDDAAMFEAIAAALDAHAKPRTSDDDRPLGQRQAEGLADICGYVLDHGALPETGGCRPQVSVLIRLEDLEARARAALLDFAGTTTAAMLRMLACDAAVIPVVLGGTGQPLDVGRITRTIPDGLRRAVAARDRGCAHPGCDRPPSWCEVHHIVPWEQGGGTSLHNCVMLCKVHHRQIHHTEWHVRIRDGLPEFIPPVWIDRHRTPRRKALPHLVSV